MYRQTKSSLRLHPQLSALQRETGTTLRPTVMFRRISGPSDMLEVSGQEVTVRPVALGMSLLEAALSPSPSLTREYLHCTRTWDQRSLTPSPRFSALQRAHTTMVVLTTR